MAMGFFSEGARGCRSHSTARPWENPPVGAQTNTVTPGEWRCNVVSRRESVHRNLFARILQMNRRLFVTGTLLSVPLLAAQSQASAAPVVLELFTSQGCSSCPPADALLGELSRQPGVIALAWHVDYWNSLGWRDPFARREWTDRQKNYAKHLNGEVYTPALVVNGATMMVGSDKAAVQRAIEKASPPPIAVSLRRVASGLEAEVAAGATPVTGMLVTYDPQQATRVDAGENLGRRLVEYRVVRDVLTLDRLTTHLTLPAIPDNQGAVLLIQDASWRIVGAADLVPARV